MVSPWIMGGLTLAYFAIAYWLWVEKHPGMAIAYAGWAIGNFGLIWEMMR